MYLFLGIRKETKLKNIIKEKNLKGKITSYFKHHTCELKYNFDD